MKFKISSCLKLIILTPIIILMFYGVACYNNEQAEKTTNDKENLPSSITLIPEKNTVEVGETFYIEVSHSPENSTLPKQADWINLTGQLTDENQYDRDIIRFDYLSWDPKKPIRPRIEENRHYFEALAPGTVNMKFGDYDLYGTCKITVVEASPTSVSTPTTSTSSPSSTAAVNITINNTYPLNLYSSNSCVQVLDAFIEKSGDNLTLKTTCINLSGDKQSVFAWKIYNSSEIVVKTGIVLENNIGYGEKFQTEDMIVGLDPGNYTLVLTNYD
ncbi:MAG: hypothetical protein E7415_00665 [Ruminococcaceae bacterium]|nr:hypothetical protein [Oscillospiraceae bacterium]